MAAAPTGHGRAAPARRPVAPDDADTPTELVVRVMTDAEHEEIKRRVELPDDYED